MKEARAYVVRVGAAVMMMGVFAGPGTAYAAAERGPEIDTAVRAFTLVLDDGREIELTEPEIG